MSDDSVMAWGTADYPHQNTVIRKPWVDPGAGMWRQSDGVELAIKDMTDKHILAAMNKLDWMTEIKILQSTEPPPSYLLGNRHGLIEYFFPKYGELRSEANRRSNPSLAL